MRPSEGQTIYRPDLGMYIMEDYDSPQPGFIGLVLMPVFEVSEQAATYPVIPAEALLKMYETGRAPRSAYSRSEWEYEEGKYSTSENGHEEPIDDRERKLLEKRAPGIVDRVATKRITDIILRSQEKRIADLIFNPSIFDVHDVSTPWSNVSGSNPVTDVNDGVSAFRKQCGMMPDALVIAFNTLRKLRENETIIERLKYTFPGIDINKLNVEQLASLFDVPRVIVGNALYDSADMGQTREITDFWSDQHAALVKIGTGDDLTQPCIGRTFVWTEDSKETPIVEVYREEQIRSDVYRVRHDSDECLMRSYKKDKTVKSDIAQHCCYLFGKIAS